MWLSLFWLLFNGIIIFSWQAVVISSFNFVLVTIVVRFCRAFESTSSGKLSIQRHQAAIEEICRCASRELELEAKMRSTEEEWTEQVNRTEETLLLPTFFSRMACPRWRTNPWTIRGFRVTSSLPCCFFCWSSRSRTFLYCYWCP